MAEEQSPKVKGVTLRSAAHAFRRIREQHYDTMLGALPRELADALRYGGIAASKWYPIEWYRALHAGMISATNEGERIIREVERSAARADMTGVYRLVFKLLSPQTLIGLSARLFSTYYDTGRVETIESRSGYVRLRWTGCTGFDRNIWAGVFASSEEMLELAGARSVRIHVLQGGGQGNDFAEAEAFWT